MKEHPIIFSGPMVRAILEGRKTQTRRVVKFGKLFPRHESWPYCYKCTDGWIWTDCDIAIDLESKNGGKKCPYGTIGDQLWVRETWWKIPAPSERDIRNGADTWPEIAYVATDNLPEYLEWGWKRKPAIHMPRWASRITLEITDIRAEKIQDISIEDVKAEGFHDLTDIGWRYVFGQGWNSINEKRGFGWSANPWVWAITFKRIQ